MEGDRPAVGDREKGADGERQLSGRPLWLLRGGVLAVALLIALVAWLAEGDDEGAQAPAEAAPRIVSEDELAEAAAGLGQPIYWAGQIAGTELELEELEGGEGTRVRYVPAGSAAGEAPPAVLTIGSYRLADPVEALQSFARKPGAIVRRAENGLELVSSEERPTSVYFADPEGAVQVEVYDPSAKRAMSLALSGDVEPAE